MVVTVNALSGKKTQEKDTAASVGTALNPVIRGLLLPKQSAPGQKTDSRRTACTAHLGKPFCGITHHVLLHCLVARGMIPVH